MAGQPHLFLPESILTSTQPVDFAYITMMHLCFQTVVQRGIAMEGATNALIQLIKDHGRWVDPPVEE